MKKVEDNIERLVLVQQPSTTGIFTGLGIAAALWVVALIVPLAGGRFAFWMMILCGGLIMISVLTRSSRLMLDRRTDELVLRRGGLLGPRWHRMRLAALAGATLQRSENGSNTLRAALVLKTPTGLKELPLSNRFTKDQDEERLVAAINEWLTRA